MKNLCQHNNSDRSLCRNCGMTTGGDNIEEEILERFEDEIRNSVTVLREESMEIERIPRSDLKMTDIVIEFRYSETYREELGHNDELRRNLGL